MAHRTKPFIISGCCLVSSSAEVSFIFTAPVGFFAQILRLDSLYETSLVADCHEQLDTNDVQDPELFRLQPSAEAALFLFGLV